MIDRSDDDGLDADALCRLAHVSVQWLQARVHDGLVEVQHGSAVAAWRFDAVALRRVRRLAELEQAFDAAPELAALVADLEAEIARLRRRLGG